MKKIFLSEDVFILILMGVNQRTEVMQRQTSFLVTFKPIGALIIFRVFLNIMKKNDKEGGQT